MCVTSSPGHVFSVIEIVLQPFRLLFKSISLVSGAQVPPVTLVCSRCVTLGCIKNEYSDDKSIHTFTETIV